MNVTIIGNVSFLCKQCRKPYTLENEAFNFEEDASPESEEDDYIRYIAQVDVRCSACSSNIQIKFDVWEFPEAVVNYSYYGVQEAEAIGCEFSVEHYFDADAVKKEDLQYNLEETSDINGESDSDEDNCQDSRHSGDAYIDHYDNEE